MKDSEQMMVDDNGIPFVISSNGTTVFGEIYADSGLRAAPIKLSEGIITNDETKEGYGLKHMEARRGEEIRKAGYKSVTEFVEFVARHYDSRNIKIGKRRKNGQVSYLIQAKDKHNNTLFIELSIDGSYWNVNSGGVFRANYGNRKENVKPASAQQDGESVPDNTLRLSTNADNSERPNGNVSSVSLYSKGSENTEDASSL